MINTYSLKLQMDWLKEEPIFLKSPLWNFGNYNIFSFINNCWESKELFEHEAVRPKQAPSQRLYHVKAHQNKRRIKRYLT